VKTPAFWRTDGWIPRLLAPVAHVWGEVAIRRLKQAPRGRAPVPVVTVGNFTAGGAGKTPVVAALVALARRAGYAPAVVSRGHGGTVLGPERVDPTRHTARDVGDEALLHARLCPTIVARDRLAGAEAAAIAGADIVFLDDGLQNTALERNLTLAVVDRGFGLGNGRVMPAGPLRAPLNAQFDLVDLVVIADAGEASARTTKMIVAKAEHRQTPVHRADFVPRDVTFLAERRVIGWAGIGRPEKFETTLLKAKAEVVEFVAFGDHQHLAPADAERLLARAAATNATLVTTAKDAARLAGEQDDALRRLAAASRVVEVDLVFSPEGEAELVRILSSLRETRRVSSGRKSVVGRISA
jgi:tetraacyldisaccharide 4'-kinase